MIFFPFVLQTELVISEPRRRTQIKRYGHDEAVVDMSDLETSSVDSDEDTAIGVGRGRGMFYQQKGIPKHWFKLPSDKIIQRLRFFQAEDLRTN